MYNSTRCIITSVCENPQKERHPALVVPCGMRIALFISGPNHAELINTLLRTCLDQHTSCFSSIRWDMHMVFEDRYMWCNIVLLQVPASTAIAFAIPRDLNRLRCIPACFTTMLLGRRAYSDAEVRGITCVRQGM